MAKSAVVIPWRQSNRKAASEFNVLPSNVTVNDYSLPNLWALKDDVIIEAVTREYRHVLNNEAISSTLAAKTKAKDEGNGATFDLVAYIHKFRMDRRAQWLDGTWGTMRGTSPVVQVDELTQEMQQLMYNKIWRMAAAPHRAKAAAAGVEFNPGDVPLPIKFDSTFASKTSIKGRTIGEMVGAMIEGDATERGGNVIRKMAQDNIDERARKHAEALDAAETAGADDVLASFGLNEPDAPAESVAAK